MKGAITKRGGFRSQKLSVFKRPKRRWASLHGTKLAYSAGESEPVIAHLQLAGGQVQEAADNWVGVVDASGRTLWVQFDSEDRPGWLRCLRGAAAGEAQAFPGTPDATRPRAVRIEGAAEESAELRAMLEDGEEGSINDYTLAWYTARPGVQLPTAVLMAELPPGVELIDGARADIYRLTEREIGQQVGVFARHVLGKIATAALHPLPVRAVPKDALSLRIQVVPHEHSRYCDRRRRVCTAVGRYREAEVLQPVLRGPLTSFAAGEYVIRFWRSERVSAEPGSAAAVASSRRSLLFHPASVHSLAQLPPAPNDAEPAPGPDILRAFMAPGSPWESGTGGSSHGSLVPMTDYPCFPADVDCYIAADIVPAAAACTGLEPQRWPVWGDTDGEPHSTALPQGLRRLCSHPVGPVEPGPPKAREIWVEGDAQEGGFLWGRCFYFGGRQGQSKVQWLRIPANGQAEPMCAMTPITGTVSSLQQAQQCAKSAAKPGVLPEDPSVYVLGPDDVGCTFKYRVVPVRDDGDEGHQEASRPCEPIQPSQAAPCPTTSTVAAELTAGARLSMAGSSSRASSPPRAASSTAARSDDESDSDASSGPRGATAVVELADAAGSDSGSYSDASSGPRGATTMQLE